MNTLVVTDLYGVTAELKSLLAPLGEDLTFLSPWPGEGCPYPDEATAHRAFLAAAGFETYARRIGEAAAGEPVLLIAFSVGATAAWLHACGEAAHPQSSGLLFYGSRIRAYADRLAHFPLEAIFAEREASFDPRELARTLACEQVRTLVVPDSAHGFMNPCSPNHDPALAVASLARIARVRQAWLAGQARRCAAGG